MPPGADALQAETPDSKNRRDYQRKPTGVCAAQQSKKKTVVSFVLRWHPLIRNLKRLLAQDALGELYYIEADYWHGIKPTFSSYN